MPPTSGVKFVSAVCSALQHINVPNSISFTNVLFEFEACHYREIDVTHGKIHC